MKSKRLNPTLPASPKVDQRLLGVVVHDLARLRRRLWDHVFASLGLNRVQWWTLGNLNIRGRDGIVQMDLARIMDVKKAAMTLMIDELEKGGFVERRPSETDRRNKQIFTTSKGEKMLQEMDKTIQRVMPATREGIDEKELQIAYSVLVRMRDNFERMLKEIEDEDAYED